MEASSDKSLPDPRGTTRYERKHLYAICSALVQGKDVADIASGSDYGPALLAKSAKSVTAIYSVGPVPDDAAERRSDAANLRFVAGAADSLPLQDKSIDVVVAFQTSEHLSDDDAMLKEFRRVLKPAGLLIMSIPHPAAGAGKNVPDAGSEEAGTSAAFGKFLEPYFGAVEFYAQDVSPTSFIRPAAHNRVGAPPPAGSEVGEGLGAVQLSAEPAFIICVASKSGKRLPSIPASFFADSATAIMTPDTSPQNTGSDQRLAALYSAIDSAEDRIKALQDDNERLRAEIAERDQRLAELYASNDQHRNEQAALQAQLDAMGKLLADREQTLTANIEALALAREAAAAHARPVAQETLDSLAAELAGAMEMRRAALQEAATVRNRLEESEIKQEEQAGLIRQLRSQLSAMSTKMADQTAQLLEKETDLGEGDYRRQQLQRQLDQAQRREATLIETIDADARRIEEVETQLRAVSQTKLADEEARNDLQRALQNARDKLEIAETGRADIERQLELQTTLAGQLRASLSASGEEVARLSSQLLTAETNAAEAERSCAESKRMLEQAERERDDARKQLATVQAQLQELVVAHDALQTLANDVAVERAAAEAVSEKRVKAAELALSSEKSALYQQRQESLALSAKIQQQSELIDRLQQKIADAERIRPQLEDALRGARDEAKASSDATAQEIADLQKQLTSSRESCAAAEAQLSALKADATKAGSAAQRQTAEIDALKRSVEEARLAQKNAEQDRNEAQSVSQRMVRDHAARIDQLEEANRALTTALAELTATATTLEVEREAALAEARRAARVAPTAPAYSEGTGKHGVQPALRSPAVLRAIEMPVPNVAALVPSSTDAKPVAETLTAVILPDPQPLAAPAPAAAATKTNAAPAAAQSQRSALQPFLPEGDSLDLELPDACDIVTRAGLFDVDHYYERNRDIMLAGIDPLQHYLTVGAWEGRNPNPLFDSAWYLRHYSDVAISGKNPLLHFIICGEKENRVPGPHFDTQWYHERYPDVREGGWLGLSHYLHFGIGEGRMPKPTAAFRLASIVDDVPEELATYFQHLDPYDAWRRANLFTSTAEAELRGLLKERAGRTPLISLVTPVYNTPEWMLREMVQSVLAQVHDEWELVLVDDASPSPHVRPLLEEMRALDPRIRVVFQAVNGGISIATTAGVEAARGEIVAFLDHDDLVTPDCIGELAVYYADHPDADIVYSDDDKIDMEGKRFAPQFKPDWSPALLLSYMYFGHIFSVRRSLYLSVGGFRKPFDGSQDYDFALRATEQARHIGHIPRILYHWRAVPGSTATSGGEKPESFEAGRKAVAEALERRNIAATAYHPDWAFAARVGMFAIDFPDQGPAVTIIIPTYNQVGYLKACVESLASSTYKNFDILVIDNESDDPDTLTYLATLKTRSRHRVVRIPKRGGKFSFAALMNEAVTHCSEEYLLFLNNDIEVINPRWLSQMMGYAQMSGVGSVGARLYFEDHTIQHAGIVHGYNEGLVGHAFRGLPPHDWGYMGFLRTAREYSAVTAGCMVTPRRIFDSVGGFDEQNFAVAYNDVDYGYRLVKAGYTNVYCSDAELFHYEGKSRSKRDDPREVIALRRIYGDWYDPWYNPNLTLEHEDFSPRAARLPSRSGNKIKVVFVSHNLAREGAPNTLMDLAIGLVQLGLIDAEVLSPADGPLRQTYEAANIPVHIFTPPALNEGTPEFLGSCNVLADRFAALGAQVVIANTLQMFFAITAAQRIAIPAIWCQHESEPYETYFDYVSPRVRNYAYAAFGQAYCVTYVAEATRRGWTDLQTRGNFKVIRHGIPPERLEAETSRWSRARARAALDVSDDDVVISLVGTVCERKGQLDLVKAVAKLDRATASKVRVFIAGALHDPDYHGEIRHALEDMDDRKASRITITGACDDTMLYYAAADIYACTSRIESAPRVLVEAMAFGLPIITTPAFGIPELVDQSINALFYEPDDIDALARLVEKLVLSPQERQKLAERSADVLNSKPGYRDMIGGYAQVIKEAVLTADPT